MQLILSNADYSFAASTKAITLASPFDVLTAEQILHIINLTTRLVVYDSERRTHPITMSTGIITHTYDSSGMADADVLQISVDDGTSIVDNPAVFLVSGTPGAGVGEVGDIAIDEDTGDIYEKEDVFVGTTWNPSDCSTELALSLGNLRATHDPSSWHGAVRSILSVPSGKWYWEVAFTKVSSSMTACIGVAGVNQPLGSELGETADSYAYKANASKKNNAVETAYGADWSTSSYTIGVAVDTDAGKIWFSRNGSWQESGDPGAGTNEAFSGISGTVYAAISIYRLNDYATANFGSSAFAYTVPTGFTAGLGTDTTPWTKKLEVPKTNLSASADPTTGDDSDDGYSVGSRWENTTDDREFVCLDATAAAAVWLRTTGSTIPEKTPVNAVASQGTISLSGVPNAVETFVIEGTTFTWVAASPGPYEVLIGATAAACCTNILTHVTPALSTCACSAGAGDTVIVTAGTKGTAGNSIVLTEASTNMTVDGTGTLGATTSGVDGTVGEANELCADATYLYHAIAANTISDVNWRRIALGSVY